MKFEKALENGAKRLFGFNPVLADKMGLSMRNFGRTTDLFLKTWMGVIGLLIIVFFLGVVVFAQIVYPDQQVSNLSESLWFPSEEHPLGTDKLGRDVMIRLLQGTKASLTVGFVAMGLSMGLGTLVGLASGYWGGWRDEVIMRVNDVFLSIPWLVLMIVIASHLPAHGTSMSVIIVIGVTGWSTTARIVRSQVLSLKARQFVERAKAIGSRRLAHHKEAHLPQRRPAHIRERHPDHRDIHPVGEHAQLPRARARRTSRPGAGSWRTRTTRTPP